MHKAPVVFCTVTLNALLLMSPAAAQGDQAETSDPLAYTPTGDALWDTYAQALLDRLENASPFKSFIDVSPPELSPELLDSWESEFGDEPRYWQLRYWNVIVHAMIDDIPGLDPVAYLEQGVGRGASDAMTEMLLYKHRRATLEENWEQLCDGTLPANSGFAPDIRENTSGFSWFVEQELALVGQLVAECPDESWAWYERAMMRFKYGEWEDGLNDLRNGNQAANNRLPRPFPIPFINNRIANEQHCGSDVAAGMALQGEFAWTLPNFIHLKDQMKNQIVRSQLGTRLSEFEPWHHYTCRFGSMEGSGSMQSLVAHILRGLMLKHLLVETPEVFTVEQRDALWGLHGRANKIKDLSKDTRHNIDDLENKLRSVYEKHGLDIDGIPSIPQLFMLTETGAAIAIETYAVYFRWNFAYYQAEHGETYRRIKERFDMLATFDFATYSWPAQE